MIASRINTMCPGEHYRGVIYRGPGPLLVLGNVQVPQDDLRPQVKLKAPFGWMGALLADSYQFETDGTSKRAGRAFLICSLVAANETLLSVQQKMNGHSQHAHDLLMDGLKRLFDQGGQGVKNVAMAANIMYMPGGVDRVYFGVVGNVDNKPIVSELAACSGKHDEKLVLGTIAVMGVDRMH